MERLVHSICAIVKKNAVSKWQPWPHGSPAPAQQPQYWVAIDPDPSGFFRCGRRHAGPDTRRSWLLVLAVTPCIHVGEHPFARAVGRVMGGGRCTRPRPSSSWWRLRRARCWSCPSRTCTGRTIGLVTRGGRASPKSIRCLPARLRQASAVRTTPIGLALTPVDGVPIGAEAVALRHVVRWEEAIPG